MRKINNKEEANQYYKQINELVDEYIQKWKVKPTEIKSYFKRNLDSFLERIGLSDVEGITRVIDDVLDHRVHMELDKVMKFESFNLLESVISIGNANTKHEKILADFYNTSMGHIELLDGDIHLYKIKDFNENVNSIIFSDEELDNIYKKIEDNVLEDAKNKVFSITEVDGVEVSSLSIKFWIKDLINEDIFRKQFKEKVDKKQVLLIIKNLVQRKQNMPINFNSDRLEYKEEYKGYHIWEVR